MHIAVIEPVLKLTSVYSCFRNLITGRASP